MDQNSISRMYADTAVLYWPWLWWQLIWIDRWIKTLNPNEHDQVYFTINSRGTIRVAYMSDRLRGLPEPFSCNTHVTFESRCWGYLPDYVWFNQLTVRRKHVYARKSNTANASPQYNEALIADP